MEWGHGIGVHSYSITRKTEQAGYHPQVILAGRRINDTIGHHAARSAEHLMWPNASI
ncbi:MAG: hypothetical protein RLZ32_2330 [Gemmatimonadota bacterium]